MFKDIKPLLKLALFSCATYFICQALYAFIVTLPMGYRASLALIIFNISNELAYGLLTAIMTAILVVISLNKHNAYQATTKNIVTTLGVTLVISIIKMLIDFAYNMGLSSIIIMLREQQYYSLTMIGYIITLIYPIKVIIFSIVLIALSYFSVLVAVNARWLDCEQQPLASPFTPRLTAIGYSLVLACIMGLLCSPISQQAGYITLFNTNSYSLVVISLILTIIITFVVHFFFIYAWSLTAIQHINTLNSYCFIKAILLSLAFFLTLFILVVIGCTIFFQGNALLLLIDGLLSNNAIITLLAILVTIVVWCALIAKVNTTLFTVLCSGFFILNLLLVIFVSMNNSNTYIATITISYYMLVFSISLLILFCFTYFPIKVAFKQLPCTPH